jgi:hypothetical protein
MKSVASIEQDPRRSPRVVVDLVVTGMSLVILKRVVSLRKI